MHPSMPPSFPGVLAQLRDAGEITGWRSELYPVSTSFGEPPVMLMERAAVPHFGIRAYGIHVNGYVVLPDGSVELWVARRSKTKQTWPGKLDHIVAGGQVCPCFFHLFLASFIFA